MSGRGWRASVLALTLAAPLAAAAQAPPPAASRRLVIHADDLGMAHSVNRAILEALEKGWVTSASLLVPCPWFPEAARWARAHPEADLGIHLALTSEWTTFRWRPLSAAREVPSLLDKEGYLPLVETTVAEKAAPDEVERELRAQVDFAQAAGVHLSHLDSHMGSLFQTAALFERYRRVGAAYRLPLLFPRQADPGGAPLPPYIQAASADALVDRVLEITPGVAAEGWEGAYEKMLGSLPPGAYELIVHLAYDDEEMRGATADHPDWGAAWRQHDFDMVRSARFRDFLKARGFTLVGWKDLSASSDRPR